ncbi:hypothetical protein JTE90_001167 [Oedothorax gibbosus]|uniref:Uncharacterized protein n=1 Tax=Oedothorax gibbosus TaxID=931172 RepID=A0AAV6VII7_9ARAC|nr:hypothetical protein JTE90_001167 [Oedothorax gibbosus]
MSHQIARYHSHNPISVGVCVDTATSTFAAVEASDYGRDLPATPVNKRLLVIVPHQSITPWWVCWFDKDLDKKWIRKTRKHKYSLFYYHHLFHHHH